LSKILKCTEQSTATTQYYQISIQESSGYVKCPENCTTCYFANSTKNFSRDYSPTAEPLTDVDIQRYQISLRCSGCLSSFSVDFFGSCIQCDESCNGCAYFHKDDLGEELLELDPQQSFLYYKELSPEEFQKIVASNILSCRTCLGNSFVNISTRVCQKCPVSCKTCVQQGENARCLKCNLLREILNNLINLIVNL
jgi:hypothetical protein